MGDAQPLHVGRHLDSRTDDLTGLLARPEAWALAADTEPPTLPGDDERVGLHTGQDMRLTMTASVARPQTFLGSPPSSSRGTQTTLLDGDAHDARREVYAADRGRAQRSIRASR